MTQQFCPSHFVRVDNPCNEPIPCANGCENVCIRTLPRYVMDFKGGPGAPQSIPIPKRDPDGELIGTRSIKKPAKITKNYI